MHIKKTLAGEQLVCRYGGLLEADSFFTRDVFEYAVHYKGFVASGPDLGALIGRCYEASLGTCSWNEAANPTL